MSAALDKAVSQLTNGFYVLAVALLALGALSVFIGRRLGGKTKRQRKTTAGLVWGAGLVILAILLVPRLFGSSA